MGAAAANSKAADAANSDARRPKHVVLADTIALLKQLQARVPLAQVIVALLGLRAVGGGASSLAAE
jgi:hypothetical protein